jgi:curved DNA-binding protein CbpA
VYNTKDLMTPCATVIIRRGLHTDPDLRLSYRPSLIVTTGDYYETLGVPPTSTRAEICRAYRRLSRRHHPDLQFPRERGEAAARYQRIKAAHAVLGDPGRRAEYDDLAARWMSFINGLSCDGPRDPDSLIDALGSAYRRD